MRISANIKDWKKIAKAHSEFFDKIRPTCTMVEGNQFIDPEILVEIEAELKAEIEANELKLETIARFNTQIAKIQKIIAYVSVLDFAILA